MPGEAVVLTSGTGLLGRPEQTEDGIEIVSLLNPLLKIGSRVQIDNASINQASVNTQSLGGFPTFQSPVPFFANISNAEHEGDTRGKPWWTRMVCLTVDSIRRRTRV
jgi:hypothetical protein